MHRRAGLRLKTAREQRKLTLQDVARATRIRPDQLHDLENDDYGNFPSPAYARSFLTLYARHLSVDVSQERESFDIGNNVSSAPANAQIFPQLNVFGRIASGTAHTSSRRRMLPVLGVVVLVALLLFSFKLMLDVNRLGGAIENGAGSNSGNDAGNQVVVAEAPAAGAGAAATSPAVSTEPSLASVGEAAPNRPGNAAAGGEEQFVIRAGVPADRAAVGGDATP